MHFHRPLTFQVMFHKRSDIKGLSDYSQELWNWNTKWNSRPDSHWRIWSEFIATDSCRPNIRVNDCHFVSHSDGVKMKF